MTSVRFGTDGIRGVAGETITAELASALGVALGSRHPGGNILVGRDTRESGVRLSTSLAAGIVAGGARPIDVGVIPTSGLAIITAGDPSIARAVAVTASHNPAEYNGLKVIGRNGRKISDEEERAVAAGIQGVPVNQSGEQVYFGIAGSSSGDKEAVIPFLQPERESSAAPTSELMPDPMNTAS